MINSLAKISLYFMLTFPLLMQGQVLVEGKLSSSKGANLLISTFSKDSHQLVPVSSDGSYQASLPRFEECLLVFYSINAKPEIYSFNTEESLAEAIKLNVQLEGPKPRSQERLQSGPAKRYVTQNGSYTSSKFNLDEVRDKADFASLMAYVSKALFDYYNNSVLPPEKIGYTSNTNEGLIRKSEHKLGEEIYLLLTKKRALNSHLQELNQQYSNLDNTNETKACNFEFTLLKKEATFAKVEFDLAEKEWQKEKLLVRRRENAGGSASSKKVINAEKKKNQKRKEYEIASLNMKNKQADCWELRLQKEIEYEISKGEAADMDKVEIRKIEVNNVRMKKRYENARQLYQQHNSLANDLTGRDRVVQLANAQKYIAEQSKIKLYQVENNLAKWKIKAKKDPALNRQVNMASQEYLKQREYAFQAEMAYLEHMWYLRDRPQVKDVLDDLFTRQNGLLALEKINRPEEEEDLVEENENPDLAADEPSTSNQGPSDAEILANVRIESRTTENGQTKKLIFKQDYYEIVVDSKGNKTYTKNGKPITKLTYEFETKRKFGDILENVKVEERRKKLWDLFKKRIE